MTSGRNKAFMDPFKPLSPEHRAYWQKVLNASHQNFIKDVKLGRGERLIINDDVFSGLIYNGTQALEQGLIDGFGDYMYVARELIKNDNVIDITRSPNNLKQILEQLSTSVSQGIINSLQRISLH